MEGIPTNDNEEGQLKSATEIAMEKIDQEEIKYEPEEKLMEDAELRKQADIEKAAEILKKLKGEETQNELPKNIKEAGVANLDVSADRKIESSLEKQEIMENHKSWFKRAVEKIKNPRNLVATGGFMMTTPLVTTIIETMMRGGGEIKGFSTPEEGMLALAGIGTTVTGMIMEKIRERRKERKMGAF